MSGVALAAAARVLCTAKERVEHLGVLLFVIFSMVSNGSSRASDSDNADGVAMLVQIARDEVDSGILAEKAVSPVAGQRRCRCGCGMAWSWREAITLRPRGWRASKGGTGWCERRGTRHVSAAPNVRICESSLGYPALRQLSVLATFMKGKGQV